MIGQTTTRLSYWLPEFALVPPPNNLVDASGRPVRLDREIGSGGEGIVFGLAGDPSRVAKLYKKPPSPQTAEKLALMAQLATGELMKVAAWPSGLLFSAGGRLPVGFLMPRVNGFEPIHHLHNPAQRLKYFPRASWRFLVHTAYNCAAAFEEVHKAGCLIGDINERNVLVSADAFVRLIDCDSFQVRAAGKAYLCEVGVALYTPPELQAQSLRGLVRTENHDRFGLAVLLFQLLFVGRHPYAGVYRGPGDLPFEQAIQEFRFAYSPNAAKYQLSQPPFAPSLADVPPDLAALFRRAFERGSERGTRPTATEWLSAIKGLRQQFATCAQDDGHVHWSGSRGCTWCNIIGQRGPDYYFGVTDSPATFTLDDSRLREVLRRLKAAELIDFPYRRDSYLPKRLPEPDPLPDNLQTYTALLYSLAGVTGLGVLLLLLGCVSRLALLIGLCVTVVFGLWLGITAVNSPWAREVRRRKGSLSAAQRDLEDIEAEWEQIDKKYYILHREAARDIQDLVDECRSLSNSYNRDLEQLTRNVQQLALSQHLRSCFISDADIPQIGDGRKQMLSAFSILTADDIEASAIQGIKGFGPSLSGSLLAWREAMRLQFRFDPSKGVPEADRRGVSAKYRKKQKRFFEEMEQRLEDLSSLAPRAKSRLMKLVPTIQSRIAAWDQAKADWQLVKRR